MYFHLNCKLRCFWRNLHRWQNFYTAAGSDGSDKFQLCVKQVSWVAAQKVRFPNGSPPHLHQEAPAGSVRGCSGLVATKAPLQQSGACGARDQGRGAWSAWNAAELVRLHPRARWGARARHLLLLKACCLRNNRCTQVGKQGQRTRSTLS